jgi:hypothetical protein
MRGGANSNGIYLFIEQRIFAFKEQKYWAYCVEKHCYNPVNNGEEVEAFINYESFGLSEEYFELPKTLKYKPEPFWCDTRRFV